MLNKYQILTLVILALLCVSCDKSSDQQTFEDFDSHPTWTADSTDNFWDKQQGGDTTIKF
jgi:hypothetical protein